MEEIGEEKEEGEVAKEREKRKEGVFLNPDEEEREVEEDKEGNKWWTKSEKEHKKYFEKMCGDVVE